MVEERLNITLHANQQVIHEHPARFKVIKAGKRFGKSEWAIFEILQKAAARPGVYWYIAPTYGQAKDIAWHRMKWILPNHLVDRWLETDLTLILKHNGSRVVLKGADNEKTLRGPGLTGAIFDERSYQPEDIWPRIIRGQLAGEKGFAYFISSPHEQGRNHYTYFYDEAKRKMDAGDKDWFASHYTIYDNPTLDRQEIEDIKNNSPIDVWNLEYLANESDVSATRFPEFQWERNVEDCAKDGLPLLRGIDWGLDHPTVCLWAKVDASAKTVYIIDEYVKSGLTVSENCHSIMVRYPNVEWSVVDPSAARRDPVTKRSVMDEFVRCGLPCFPGDRRDRGVDIVRMFLKKGMVKISPKCKQTIFELKNLMRDAKVGDDATDALRYLLVRIHDSFAGMNVFENEGEPWVKEISKDRSEGKSVYSLFDKKMFPQENREQHWVFEEIA